MKSKIIIQILALALVGAAKATRSSVYKMNDRCETIKIPICKDIPYNQTMFPNLMGNHEQDEAATQIHQYHPLIKIKCSADIQLFLCSMYAPLCTILDKPLKPCRDLCESARKGCESLMKKFGYNWPDAFDCSKFPDGGNSGDVCMKKEDSGSGSNNSPFLDESDLERINNNFSPNHPQRPVTSDDGMDFICPAQFKAPRDLDYSLRVNEKMEPDCGAPCYGMFYNEKEIYFLQVWNGVWALFCILSASFIILTYMIETLRFPYPQMAIIHMGLCSLAVELLFIIGFCYEMAGNSVACGQPFDTDEANLSPERLIRQGTIEDWRCSVIGMALYFFTMARALWWVMLTVAWFLNGGWTWGSEAIESKASSYMHAIVWSFSAIQTVVVIVFKENGGDILSGVCFVGLWDSRSLLYFVIIPLVLYTTIGMVMLAIGLCYSWRSKEELKNSGLKTDKTEILMQRIGLFAFFYLVPAIAVIGCHIFEWYSMDTWMANWQERVCRDEELSQRWQIPCKQPGNSNPVKQEPDISITMLKYAAIHLTSAFIGTWIFVPKTIDSWKRWYYRRLNGQEPAQL